MSEQMKWRSGKRYVEDRKRLTRPEREVALALQLAIWALGRAGSDFAAEHIQKMVKP